MIGKAKAKNRIAEYFAKAEFGKAKQRKLKILKGKTL